MAGSYTCRSPCKNFLLIGNDEFASAAPTKGSGTLSFTPVVSYIPTAALAPPLASAKLIAKYINVDLQRVSKLVLKLFV